MEGGPPRWAWSWFGSVGSQVGLRLCHPGPVRMGESCANSTKCWGLQPRALVPPRGPEPPLPAEAQPRVRPWPHPTLSLGAPIELWGPEESGQVGEESAQGRSAPTCS